jgi:hypothetical protein
MECSATQLQKPHNLHKLQLCITTTHVYSQPMYTMHAHTKALNNIRKRFQTQPLQDLVVMKLAN